MLIGLLFFKRPLLALISAGLIVDGIFTLAILKALGVENILPEGVKFGFYKTDKKKG